MKHQTIRVRRFEPGASGMGYDDFLQGCGYIVAKHLSSYTVRRQGAKGRGKLFSRKQMVELLDSERMKRGLQPIQRRAA